MFKFKLLLQSETDKRGEQVGLGFILKQCHNPGILVRVCAVVCVLLGNQALVRSGSTMCTMFLAE